MTFYTRDYQMTAAELQAKYCPDDDTGRDGQHPGYPWWDWLQQVAQGVTRDGYWEWVRLKLEQEEVELDRDNPYNQPWSDNSLT